MHVVTMQDVAKRAGTSVAVVSYVMNNGPRPVAAATRERVLAAVAELNYRPNNAARSLRRRRTQILGLVVPDNAHPFFASLARVFERLTYDHGYVVVSGNSFAEKGRERAYYDLFREHQVAGVMLAASPTSSVQDLLAAGIPVVLLDEAPPKSRISSLSIDNRVAALEATQYLIDLGHRSVAFVGGKSDVPSANSRFRGWKSAMSAAGLGPASSERLDFTRAAGYDAGTRLLSGRTRPTAVLISSDQQAVGFLHAANGFGVNVPHEVAVMAFDDSDDCRYASPPLSTVRQPLEEMVSRGLELLLSPPPTPVNERFPHELIRRASTEGEASPTLPTAPKNQAERSST